MSAPTQYLEGQERRDRVQALIRTLDDPHSTAEQMLTAQDELDWFAREIQEWFRPVGYKLLVYIPYLQARMENNLEMPQESRAAYQTASVNAYVLAMGPAAYKDETRFPGGAWCAVGDRVVMRRYAGTRFKRTGYPFEYALINDDTVEGVMNQDIKIEGKV